ncbi:MAG: hypothetical protein H6613_10345 [Ignavibacteriales bacterium]|nr:hypothetical protein [Ignavibacteriota bacterium]MCB9248901.1 hypothetical protein [Ignavibacteriales bacterium]
MKRLINLSVILLVLSVFASSIMAQEEVNTQERKMVKNQTLQGTNNPGPNWVDADGDGLCDNIGTGDSGKQMKGANAKGAKQGNKKGGFGDGTGVRPQDGTGLGAGVGTGTADCDGTGPKGSVKRSGRN